MALVFVTKQPTSAKKEKSTTRLFENSVRLNSKDFRFSITETVIDALDKYKENPALELAIGFAYDSESEEVYIFVASPDAGGIVPGKTRAFTNQYHTEQFLSTMKKEDLKGKVLVFDVDLDNIVDHDGTVLAKLTLADTQDPRIVVREKKSQTGTAESLAEKEGDHATDAGDLNPVKAAQVTDMWPSGTNAAEAKAE